ncbi:hypothetical protein [Sulfoacidibacillus ferrooxidans]|uniref:Uncharacterized protein n=1 Tax=Sulfoacidibacillus ferrooxidans TaxID=2005001 RepID=A0A9X2ACM9_9BACL|nr:hypothetical protein [Sulfoacidibacillus ferrooxidans]MCI0183954.1 hypothetical protein [Sulfoacidibacillus ferrooxidans]
MKPYIYAIAIGILGISTMTGCGTSPLLSSPSTTHHENSTHSSISSPKSTSKTSSPTVTILPAKSTNNGSSVVTSPSAQVILYTPMMWAVNTVRVSGRVIDPTSNKQVTIWTDISSGYPVAKAVATLSADGRFHADFHLTGAGPQTFTFHASYQNGQNASLQRTINVLPMSTNWPTPLVAARNQARQMGTTFPIWEPTWLPQTISRRNSIKNPYISVFVAAKSFTYTDSIFETNIPYEINEPELNSIAAPLLADVGGTHFASNHAARQQMMYGVHQVLANQIPTGTIHLETNLNGIIYQGKQKQTIVWHEGDWTLGVRGPDSKLNVEQAKEVTNILNSIYLPPTHGLVWIRNLANTHGTVVTTQIEISFAEDSNLFSITSQGNLYDALVMASSMKEYLQ